MNDTQKKYYAPLGDGGTVFVTGASGLVGSHLVRALLQQQKKVKALYRNNIPTFDGAENVQWIKGNILDIISLEAAMENVQQVYHCAAIVSFNPKDKTLLHKTNVEGTLTVKGKEQKVNVPATIEVKGTNLSASANFSIVLADFGITGTPIDGGKVAKAPKITVSADFK